MAERETTRRAQASLKRGERGAAEPRTGELPRHVSRAVGFCLERKARDGVVLDLRGISNATDYFLIVSGESDTHVRAIAERVLEGMDGQGVRPAGVEGLSAGRWVLLDYIDAVIHVFHPTAREYYRLERLWGDAPAWTVRDAAEEP